MTLQPSINFLCLNMSDMTIKLEIRILNKKLQTLNDQMKELSKTDLLYYLIHEEYNLIYQLICYLEAKLIEQSNENQAR